MQSGLIRWNIVRKIPNGEKTPYTPLSFMLTLELINLLKFIDAFKSQIKKEIWKSNYSFTPFQWLIS